VKQKKKNIIAKPCDGTITQIAKQNSRFLPGTQSRFC